MDPPVKPENDGGLGENDSILERMTWPPTIVIPDGDPEPILPWMALWFMTTGG